MNSFALVLQDATRIERIDGVVAFVGSDASGSFGLRPGHERMITELAFGLARYRVDGAAWQYLAAPGALLYFRDDTLTLCARRFVRGDDHRLIAATLHEQLQSEEQNLRRIKVSLRQMEDAILKRLYELDTRGARP